MHYCWSTHLPRFSDCVNYLIAVPRPLGQTLGGHWTNWLLRFPPLLLLVCLRTFQAAQRLQISSMLFTLQSFSPFPGWPGMKAVSEYIYPIARSWNQSADFHFVWGGGGYWVCACLFIQVRRQVSPHARRRFIPSQNNANVLALFSHTHNHETNHTQTTFAVMGF